MIDEQRMDAQRQRIRRRKQLLIATATDGAGNTLKQEIPIVVHHASPVAAGPGSVEPITGEFNLSNTDVRMSSAAATLTVSRTYQSRHLTAGAKARSARSGP